MTILTLGVVTVAAMVIKGVFDRLHLPSAVGYILLGLGLRGLHSWHPFLGEQGKWVLEILASLGVIALLFRIGLGSELQRLRKQFGKAGAIGLLAAAFSALCGYVACRLVLGYPMIPSLVVATALTATSVGIPAAVWKRLNALQTAEGELFLDIAEFDDLLGIVLFGLLFAILPQMKDGSGGNEKMLLTLARSGTVYIIKLLVFISICYLFSHFLERRVTKIFKRLESPPDPMLAVTGIAICIAAAAGLLGFSVAIGAFFAGLVFSRDPEATTFRDSFCTLQDFLTPFFFLSLGFHLHVKGWQMVLWPALILVLAACVGKFFGNAVPSLLLTRRRTALLLGVSMLPRAEISMIIMKRGQQLGQWAVPPEIFSAMVISSGVTCIVGPLLLQRLLLRRGGADKKDQSGDEAE